MALTTDQTEARRFIKKPVTIEAIQWTGKNLHEVLTFMYGHTDMSVQYAGMTWETYVDMVEHLGPGDHLVLPIYTLEDHPDGRATRFADIGDWIIRGVKGEYYPCKPDIFEATYSPEVATRTQPAPANQQAGIPGNFITHRAAWRKALETAKFFSIGDDRSYWDRELAAFDRSFDRLWTLMQDAPHPSPTAQVVDIQVAIDRDRIREIFMTHGFTVKEGQTDLKQYVYDAAEALLRASSESVREDADRYFFDAGWKACANFCDRDDVRFDGIVGHRGCPQFEEAFRAAHKQEATMTDKPTPTDADLF